MWARVIWPAAIVAFLCDLAADAAFGNGTVNLITTAVVFLVVAAIRYAMLTGPAR